MTICLATDSFPPHNSGIATHNLYQARLFKEAGINLVVLTVDFENRKKADSIEQRPEATVITLRKSYEEQFDHFSKFIKTGNREAVVWISTGMAMRKWLLTNEKEYPVDLIECSDYGGFGLFLIDEQLPPLVVMCHGLLTQMDRFEFHNQDENLSIIRFLETNMIRQADAVICHSQMNADDINRDFNAHAIYATAPWIHDHVEKNEPVTCEFIVSSRLTVHKGALVMAEVMNSLIKEEPLIKVLWIGQDTYTAPDGWIVSKYIRKHFPTIWQKTFVWKNAVPRDEMMRQLSASESVIIPSSWETFNYVALEAADRKKALIVTRQTGIAEKLKDGENMLLTDASDINSIKNAMIRIHCDKSLAPKLGNNFYQSTKELFSKENFIKDRQLAYQEAIENRKHRTLINPLKSFF